MQPDRFRLSDEITDGEHHAVADQHAVSGALGAQRLGREGIGGGNERSELTHPFLTRKREQPPYRRGEGMSGNVVLRTLVKGPNLTESESRGSITGRIRYWRRFTNQHLEAGMDLRANESE